MITNLPTQDSLNNAALKIYFRAWGNLIEIWSDFLIYSDTDITGISKHWLSDWEEYLVEAQSDLQAIYSLLQQAMELGLKARICGVSPYLLLLNSGMKLTSSPKKIDFSELRTLDAVDLPGAVNTLTQNTVSDRFITRYNNLRSLRNKIVHLGNVNTSLIPYSILRDAVALYHDLWADRHWLQDRLEFATQSRRAWFHDHKYTSPHMEIFHEWPIDIALFTNKEFKVLFGKPKSARRYLCHYCIDQGDTRYADFDLSECGTAYLDEKGHCVRCLMCCNTYPVVESRCEECNGGIICGDTGDWAGRCYSCGA